MPKKTPASLLLGFCLLSPSLLALAPHPTVVTVKHGDEFLPVVKVHGDTPYVLIDGKEQSIKSEPVYLMQDAPGFSHNFVDAGGCGLSGEFKLEKGSENNYDPSAEYSGHMNFEFPLLAEKTISGGFITIVLYTADTFLPHPRHPSPAQVIVQGIPDLPAGRSVPVKISIHALARELEPKFFVQVFDETGREVRSSDIEPAWEYYTLRDRYRLALAVKKYLKKYEGTDHEAVPAFTPRPIFKPGAVLPQGEVTVTLSVNDDGSVINVDAGMIADDSARESISEALGGWLFLPKLKAGQPVFTYINVPLQF